MAPGSRPPVRAGPERRRPPRSGPRPARRVPDGRSRAASGDRRGMPATAAPAAPYLPNRRAGNAGAALPPAPRSVPDAFRIDSAGGAPSVGRPLFGAPILSRFAAVERGPGRPRSPYSGCASAGSGGRRPGRDFGRSRGAPYGWRTPRRPAVTRGIRPKREAPHYACARAPANRAFADSARDIWAAPARPLGRTAADVCPRFRTLAGGALRRPRVTIPRHAGGRPAS